jgi:hypothetical protein
MNSLQKKIWSELRLPDSKDPIATSEALNAYVKKQVSPKLQNVLSAVLKEAESEIRRTGGNWETNQGSVKNMLDNLYSTIIGSMVPDEIIDKLPSSPDT